MSEPQQQPTGVPDGWEVVAPATPPAAKAGRDFKILGVNIHVPAEEKPRADSNIIGWGSQGGGVAPEDLLGGGMAVRGVARAASGGAGAAAKAALAEATPQLKYELTKTALERMGVPGPIAMPIALVVSGYRGNGKKPTAPAEAPHVPTAEGYSRYEPSASGYQAEPMPAAAPRAAAPGPPASASPSPAPSAPTPPVGPSALSVEEQAAQRLVQQGYPADRARAAVAEPPPSQSAAPATPKPMLLAADFAAVQRLTNKGMPLQKAIAQVQAERALAERLGLPSPEEARQSVADRNKTGRWKKDE